MIPDKIDCISYILIPPIITRTRTHACTHTHIHSFNDIYIIGIQELN